MRTPKNPFLLSGYHSPHYFCDRQYELAWLIEQFDNERNAVIYAYRRMGKTALIRHFFYHLQKKKQAQTIFVDLLGTSSMAEANKKLATAIFSQMGNPAGMGKKMLSLLSAVGASISMDPVSGAPQVTVGLVQPAALSRSMDAMGDYLKTSKKPVVIAIDEFQHIVNYQDANAEAVFRSWTQDFPLIRFVFSGSHRHMMQTMFSDQNRPFYGSAQLLSLDPIEPSEYKNFIKGFFKKEGLTITDKMIDSIFSWARRQTYYVQLLCNNLFAKGLDPDDNLLSEVQQEILQQESPLFSLYQPLLTDFQWQVLKAMAQAESVSNPTSREFIEYYHLGAASSVSSALSTLIKKEFIVHEGGRYSLHDTLLMRWLQQL